MHEIAACSSYVIGCGTNRTPRFCASRAQPRRLDEKRRELREDSTTVETTVQTSVGCRREEASCEVCESDRVR